MNATTRKLRLLYFASLREARGVATEDLVTTAATPAALYEEIARRHGFNIPADRLRIAVNGEFAEPGCLLNDGDEVVFIPPVAGG